MTMRRAAGWLARILIFILVAVLLTPVVLPPFLDRTYYRGPVSDHFDGHRFFNPDGEQGTGGGQHGLSFILSLLLGKDRQPWPAHIPVTPTRPAARVAGEAMRITWIGHSTVLVQTQGLNILTDPTWSERDSPFSFAGPKRVREPGVRFADLPPIDLVLVSHNHYDHLDLPTLERLWRRDHPLIVTGLGNDTLLGWHGIRSRAIDWGQSVAVRPGITVKAERVHHWTSRWMADRNRALWTGFALFLPGGGNLYFAGDTGAGDWSWPVVAARDGPYRFALIPIGAYRPRGLLSGNHIDPREAARAFEMLGAQAALGIHWGTFQLSYEAVDEPPRDLRAALIARGIDPARFRTLEAGRSWDVPPLAQAKTPSAATSSSLSSSPKPSASAAR
jgi:L-ascorbate metabolism protein UlaG (beta-lactamase superfamily)